MAIHFCVDASRFGTVDHRGSEGIIAVPRMSKYLFNVPMGL